MYNAFDHENTTCNNFLNSSKLQQFALLEQKLRSSAVSCLNFACLMKFLADFFLKNITILSYISSKIHFLKPFYCVTIDIWAVPLMISSRLDFESEEHIIIKCENIIIKNF